MDFTNRSTQNQSGTVRPTVAGGPDQSTAFPPTNPKGTHKGADHNNHDHRGDKWIRLSSVVLLFVVAILVAAVVGLIYTAKPATQDKYVDTNKLQAVFLNTGQVYFGNVKTLNSNYIVLTNIFYLQSSSSSTSKSSSSDQNVSLVKLGCELHEPYDQMVINANQVTFWENLQSDGQVAQAVSKYDSANPDGQKCSDQSAAPNSNSGVQSQNSNAQNSTSPSGTSGNTTKNSTDTKQ